MIACFRKIHYGIAQLNITSIEKNRTWIEYQGGHEKKYDFNRVATTIDKITIEYIGVVSRWKTILVEDSTESLS
jgi:hypothetical protein